MPLYECENEKCRAVENTALGNYWTAQFDGTPKLCSECATGTWHAEFPKRTKEEAGFVLEANGAYLSPPGGWK